MVAKPTGLETFEEADRRLRASHPKAEAFLNRTAQKRKISEFLLRARYRAGLRQVEVAKNAGMSKSQVSRLEDVSGPVPDILTVLRYMTACKATIGLVAIKSIDPDHSQIVDAIPLNVSELAHVNLLDAPKLEEAAGG